MTSDAGNRDRIRMPEGLAPLPGLSGDDLKARLDDANLFQTAFMQMVGHLAGHEDPSSMHRTLVRVLNADGNAAHTSTGAAAIVALLRLMTGPGQEEPPAYIPDELKRRLLAHVAGPQHAELVARFAHALSELDANAADPAERERAMERVLRKVQLIETEDAKVRS